MYHSTAAPDPVQLKLLSTHSLGTAIQAAVLVYSGYASHSSLQERLESPNLHTGFILQAISTIMVTIGTMLCAWIIDDSTEETEWVGKPLADKMKRPMNISWIYKRHFTGDQYFPSFDLFPDPEYRERSRKK